MTEVYLIRCKEVAAYNEEYHYSRQHLSNAAVKTKVGGYLTRALLQEAYQQGGEYHYDRVEL